MTRRLLVIGGDAAGMSAASQARRLCGPDDLEIVAFERGRFTSYAACGIPYWIAGLVEDRQDLIARDPATFRDDHDIQVHTRTEVVAIDPAACTVTARDLAQETDATYGYDDLLVATGATPARPPIPGIDLPGVLGVQTLEDGQQVLDALADRHPRRAVVVGGGYIGLEMAEAMTIRGLDVTVVDRSPQPMVTIDVDLGARIADAMRGMGMTLHLGVEVEEIAAGDDGWVRAVETAAGTLEADIVVLGTGTRPNADLAAQAGIAIGPTGGIATDAHQRTGTDGVWAAGDCAQTVHRVSGEPVAIALGTIANKQGRVAGLNLGGVTARFPGVLGTAVTKVCAVEIARTGLSEVQARNAGLDPVSATINGSTRAGYYPGARPITVRVVAARDSGRLLGAQIVGEEGAAKRIDVFATALWNAMTVEDMINLDLAYAPPFSPVWDPVLIAARQGANAVAGAG